MNQPIELNHVFEIYVPSECICGELLPEIEREEALDEIKSTLSKWFNGATTDKVEGDWLLPNGRLAKEPVDVVVSFATEKDYQEYREEFIEFVSDLANRLTQDGVLCRIDGKGLIYKARDLPEPHRCMQGRTRGGLPIQIQPNEKQSLLLLEASLKRLNSTRAAKDLFCNILQYLTRTHFL